MMESMRNGNVTAVGRRGGMGELLLDGGVDGTDQVCTDPKVCGQPNPVMPEAELDPDPSVCTDPKVCGQPVRPTDSIPQ